MFPYPYLDVCCFFPPFIGQEVWQLPSKPLDHFYPLYCKNIDFGQVFSVRNRQDLFLSSEGTQTKPHLSLWACL